MSDSKVIYKYELPIDDEWHPLPAGRVVHVGRAVGDAVLVWIEQDPLEQNTFMCRVVGTGQSVHKWHRYVGTTINEPFVWHVYARGVPTYGLVGGEKVTA